MKKLIALSVILSTLGYSSFLKAQKISDGESLDVNGMTVSYSITNKESIEVGGKPFDRYKVSASVKNTSQNSFSIRATSYPQVISNKGIVELDCINATGAKLTSKKMVLNLKTHMINATLSAYDKNGKFTNYTIPIIAGYYFDSGDTINDNAIFIVPKGETPEVKVKSLR